MVDQGGRGEWTSSPGSTVFRITVSWTMEGRRSPVQFPKWLSNNFGNKGFDKAGGSEVELVRRLGTRTGDRLSTCIAIEAPDKPLRRQGGRNSTPKTDRHGIGRCQEMQPEVQLGHIPPALSDWQQGGPWPQGLHASWQSGAHSEQVQALEREEASPWDQSARSLLNSTRLRDQRRKHFLSRRAFCPQCPNLTFGLCWKHPNRGKPQVQGKHSSVFLWTQQPHNEITIKIQVARERKKLPLLNQVVLGRKD